MSRLKFLQHIDQFSQLSIMVEEGPAPKRAFGLSFPAKPKSQTTTTTNKLLPVNKSCLAAAAFSVDDDDDDDLQTNPLASKKKKPPTLNAKTQRDIEQALEEDPNIYEYDAVYEKVSSTVQQEQKREEKRRLERESNVVRQPKYVAGLLEKSKQREKELERVKERQIQRERQLEGDMYADKEVFVTPAYKAKLAERQADVEREKLEEKREAMLNVTGQDNMDAFYRFQFKLRTGEATILEESEKTKPTFSSTNDRTRAARQLRSRATNEDEDEQMETNLSAEQTEMYARARGKPIRSTEQEEIKEEIPTQPKPRQPVKVRRINDEASRVYDDEQLEMGVGLAKKKKKKEEEEQRRNAEVKENQMETAMPLASEKKQIAQETRLERIQRLCIKRTVGEVLQAAQQAYYERQQRRTLHKDYIERPE